MSRGAVDRTDHVIHDLIKPIPEGTLPERVDAIVHCAANVDERAVGFSIVDSNLRITFHVAEFARKAQTSAFVNLSSVAVYGAPSSLNNVTEASPARPVTPYGLAKMLGESLLTSLPISAVSHLRLGYVIGPNMPDRYFPVRVAERFKANKAVTVMNPYVTRFSFIETSDVARACEAALTMGVSGPVNLVADHRPTPREVIDTIAAKFPGSTSVITEESAQVSASLLISIPPGPKIYWASRQSETHSRPSVNGTCDSAVGAFRSGWFGRLTNRETVARAVRHPFRRC